MVLGYTACLVFLRAFAVTFTVILFVMCHLPELLHLQSKLLSLSVCVFPENQTHNLLRYKLDARTTKQE